MIDLSIKGIHVDRQPQLGLFRSMKTGELGAHILLIQAQSGMGKSALLLRFLDDSRQLRKASVDFKKRGLTCEVVMDQLRDQLTGSFPKFSELLEKYSAAGARVEGSVMVFSKKTINVGQTEERILLMQRQLLTSAFVTDLRASNSGLDPVVLTIDTFELATTELRDWMDTHFVPAVLPLPWLVLVVAGQEIPELDHTVCVSTPLGFMDRDDLREYVRRIEEVAQMALSVSDEEIRIIHIISEGRPFDFVPQVLKLCKSKGLTLG